MMSGLLLSCLLAAVVFDFGDNPFVFAPSKWQPGQNEWPGHNFIVPEGLRDWSGYDRLVLEFFNRGGTDPVFGYLAAPWGRVQDGLKVPECYVESDVYRRWIIPLKDWPKTMDARNVGRIHLFLNKPQATCLDFYRATLLKEREDLPEPLPRFDGRAELPFQQQRRREVLSKFIGACRAAGQTGRPFFLGKASSMEKVRPRSPENPPSPATSLGLALAQGEVEATQLFVLSKDDHAAVGVRVSTLRQEGGNAELPPSDVRVSVMGYVNAKRRPPYCVARNRPCETNGIGFVRERRPAEIGWWPDPILDYLSETDVKAYDLQGFWMSVRAPRNQHPGRYCGVAEVTTNGVTAMTVPLSVRVYGFQMPEQSPLKLAITFFPWPFAEGRLTKGESERLSRLTKDERSPVNQWKRHRRAWIDFLADHYISINHLCRVGSPDVEELRQSAVRGKLDGFQLGFWGYPDDLLDETKARWERETLDRLRRNWEKVSAAGLGSLAYLYGCDEAPTDRFDCIQWAVGRLKATFPQVPILTTAYDTAYGVGTPLEQMDWFTPLTSTYNVKKAADARQKGHQVWWYICCGPKQPYANMFVESEAIEGRSLMGAQTAKYRPDGFLYYQISIWNAERPISGTNAFTDWELCSWRDHHGDGSWTYCGPGGRPMTSQRLENFRDGIEDLAYVRELERRLDSLPSPEARSEARSLIAVPDRLVRDLKTFSDDPDVLYAWRNRMGELIESARGEEFE